MQKTYPYLYLEATYTSHKVRWGASVLTNLESPPPGSSRRGKNEEGFREVLLAPWRRFCGRREGRGLRLPPAAWASLERGLSGVRLW